MALNGELLCYRCIQFSVIRENVIYRVLLGTALGLGLLMLGALDAEATPIRPDIRKLLQQPADRGPQFAPARAGWHGPEAAAPGEASTSPTLEKFSPAASARALRATLVAAAIPDWRVVIAIVLLILVLRKLRRQTTIPQQSASEYESTDEMRPAA